MKVYVISSRNEDDMYIRGVFTNLEKAIYFVKKTFKTYDIGCELKPTYIITELELDSKKTDILNVYVRSYYELIKEIKNDRS